MMMKGSLDSRKSFALDSVAPPSDNEQAFCENTHSTRTSSSPSQERRIQGNVHHYQDISRQGTMSFRVGNTWTILVLSVAVLLLSPLVVVDAFGAASLSLIPSIVSSSSNNRIYYMTTQDDISGEGIGDGDLDSAAGGNLLKDLSWRVAKLRLEEENRRRFLKAKPRYLPYDECRKWVQAWNRWDNEQDWIEWIDQGEKRNAYIPARPDEYYGRLGQWRGWDHFLSKVDSDDRNGKDKSAFD